MFLFFDKERPKPRMKLILFFVISCLALHNGKGAPTKAVYKFVRCNPEGDQANCVTMQSPEMAWTPELPAKLPAETAQYLEAQQVEDDTPEWEEGKVEEDDSPMMNQEGYPDIYLTEEGSGVEEGSAAEGMTMAGWAMNPESDLGSGESWSVTENEPSKDEATIRRIFLSRLAKDQPAEPELRKDDLIHL